MKTFVSRIAGISASVMMASSMAVAIDDFNPEKAFGKECYGLVAEFEAGMKSIDAVKAKPTEEQVTMVTAEFKQIISSSDQARRCYLQKMSSKEGAAHQDELRVGAFKAGVIFEKAQAQFGGWIDDMSVVLLSDVAPAAGGGAEANLAAEAKMEVGMELLINSYMLLENAEVLGEKMVRLGNRGE